MLGPTGITAAAALRATAPATVVPVDPGIDLDGAVLLATVDAGSAMLRIGSNEIKVGVTTSSVAERVVSNGRLFVTDV